MWQRGLDPFATYHPHDHRKHHMSTANANIIAHISHATLFYEGGVQALDDISLDIHEGERLCILGHNGSGKSTLASVLAGLLAPDSGLVELVGQKVFHTDAQGQPHVDFDAYRTARRELGLVFQNPDDQIVTSIVEEDVAFGPENLGIPAEEIGRRVARELHRVAMQPYAKADPTKLSGGQKQRVAIAGALATHPRMLVLDEPGALLDVRGRRSIMEVMAKLKAAGTTVVHITHFMEEALEADRVVVMNHGHIVLEGTPTEVFSHVGTITSLGLRGPWCARLSTRLRELGMDVPWTCQQEELRDSILRATHKASSNSDGKGRSYRTQGTAADQKGVSEPNDPIIRVDDVSYSYHTSDGRDDSRPALDGVSLTIRRGSNTAIIGQTGSGKSTLLRLLCALDMPDRGHIVVDGIDTQDKKGRRTLRGTLGYVMQYPERQLFAETVEQDVCFGPRNLGLSEEEVKSRCKHALELVGLSGFEKASPFELSGGQQRMCAIAGILAMQPPVLILDEPSAGLDPRGRTELSHIVDDLCEHGVTIVQVTHSRAIAVRADEVIVLNQSRILMHGRPEEVFSYQNEKTLHDVGLGIPTSLEWARDLQGRGIRCAEAPLTMTELADSLAAEYASPARHDEEAMA